MITRELANAMENEKRPSSVDRFRDTTATRGSGAEHRLTAETVRTVIHDSVRTNTFWGAIGLPFIYLPLLVAGVLGQQAGLLVGLF